MTKRKRAYIEICVLAILGGSLIACHVLSGDRPITSTILELFGIALVVVFGLALVEGLIVGFVWRYRKFLARFEKSGLLWLFGFNAILMTFWCGTVLYRYIPVIWNLWSAGGDMLQNGAPPFLSLLGPKELKPFFLVALSIFNSVIWWRAFIGVWRTSKVEECSKVGTSGFGN